MLIYTILEEYLSIVCAVYNNNNYYKIRGNYLDVIFVHDICEKKKYFSNFIYVICYNYSCFIQFLQFLLPKCFNI